MNIKDHYAYGIYQVGAEQFFNKTQALTQATAKNLPVHWNFHDHIFGNLDWTKRPAGTLGELYKQRAQQLRDQYDYVIVNFSGGADSWTVLHSFLANGIHVDEIFTRWSFAERKYKLANHTDTRESNLTSEYEFAVVPVLEDIRKRFPNTFIYVDDYSAEYEKDLGESDIQHSGHYLALGTFFRFTRKSPGEQQAIQAGKRVAVIHGFDKIQFCVKQDQAYAYFVDRIGGTDLDPERNIEAFYWTPDMPELPILQAHELKTFYQLNPSRLNESVRDYERKTYLGVCYPNYNPATFQVGKPTGTEIWQSETWIREHNPRYVESWQWSVNQLMTNIDTRFCEMFNNKFRLGLKTMSSNLYCLGNFTKLDT